MKTPTLEEVKEHFKDAEAILTVSYGHKKSYCENTIIYNTTYNSYYTKNGASTIWNSTNGYAEIITYKNNKKNENIKQRKL